MNDFDCVLSVEGAKNTLPVVHVVVVNVVHIVVVHVVVAIYMSQTSI